ncbi:MAG: Gfo/Idh/MocA family oxidoreductase, partial [Bryobacteraceae bacterium]
MRWTRPPRSQLHETGAGNCVRSRLRCLRNRRSFKQWAGPDARAYSDFRKVLEQKDIDAVMVSTPDHWHAIPTILACEAGKDVYVEKPIAHNTHEGRAMVNAAASHKQIVFTGTQQRSALHFSEIAKIVQGGQLAPV